MLAIITSIKYSGDLCRYNKIRKREIRKGKRKLPFSKMIYYLHRKFWNKNLHRIRIWDIIIKIIYIFLWNTYKNTPEGATWNI